MKKLLIILFLIPLLAQGQRPMVAGWNENKVKILSSNFYYPAMIRLPSDYFDAASATKRYPIIFMFHGTGKAGSDTVKVLEEGWPKNLSNNGSTSYTHEGATKTVGSDNPTANDFNGNSRTAIIVVPQATSYGVNPAWVPYMFADVTGRLGLRVDSSMVGLYGLSAGGWASLGTISKNTDTSMMRFVSAIIVNSGATQDLTPHSDFKKIADRRIPTLLVAGVSDVSYYDQMDKVRDTINFYSNPDVAIFDSVPGQGHSGFDANALNSKKWTKAGTKSFIEWFMLQHNTYATTWTPPVGGSTPVANAGVDQNIWLPKTTTTLTGSGSTGTITSITWTKLSSSPHPQEAALVSNNTLNVQVNNLPLGIHTFRIAVTDGSTTSYDTVNVRVYPFRSKTPNPTHRKINLTKSGNDYYYTNVIASLGPLNGSDTLNFTQSANLVQLYGDDGSGGWGGDSVNKLVITADPGVVIKQMRINGQYIKIVNMAFDNTGASSPILVATTKSRKVEIANNTFKGGDNAIYVKSRLDTNDVLSQHPNWDLEGFYIHHNVMTDQEGEGVYFNTTFSDEDTLGTSDFGDYPPVNASNLVFTYNITKRSGWDANQFSKAPHAYIGYNIIDSAGLRCKSAQLNGIIVGGYSPLSVVEFNDIRNTKGAGVFIASNDTNWVRNNFLFNTGYSDIQTDLNCNSGNPYTAMDITDNIIASLGTPSPTLVAMVTDNCIQGLTSYTGGAAIRLRNSHATMRPGYVTGNKLLDPIGGRLVSNLIYDNVAGNNVSGNTLASCTVNIPPAARAGLDQITIESFTTLDGSLSGDPDGTISTYLWEQLSGPSGATFSTTSQAQTTISDMIPGTYKFRLTVTDNLGATSTDEIDVTVTATPVIPGTKKTRANWKKPLDN